MPSVRDRKTKGTGFGYDGYLSPFTWRYGSKEMRELFSEEEKRARWRRVWLALAKAEEGFGLLSKEELAAIRSKSGKEHVDIPGARALEARIGHDLVSELKTFAAQAKKGGGKIHLGATSADVEDNADMTIYRDALGLVAARLRDCIRAGRSRILEFKGTPCMAWTHLQPAEPTTLGYRFAGYAQDLVLDLSLVDTTGKLFMMGKGIKGAVGTSASYAALLGGEGPAGELEKRVMDELGLGAFAVSAQTYPRKADYLILACLASIGQSCYKFGLDLRVMQSPAFGELSEPISGSQVGSSAMPFKRNPVMSERMCSLARYVSALPQVAFSNAANSILERTLDDSAARRIVLPEAFLAIDECLLIYRQLLSGTRVHLAMVRRNLDSYGPFAGTEALMMKLVKAGGDRQKLHEMLRAKSFAAWEEVTEGRPNTLVKRLASDKRVSAHVSTAELRALMDPTRYTGAAEKRCEEFVKKGIDPVLASAAGLRRPRRRARRGPSGPR